ncbi:MAG: sigma-70 family RNA polymerase sigma factor [Planctomycetaceae bacterium]
MVTNLTEIDLADSDADNSSTPDESFIRAFSQSQRPLYLYILPLVGNPADADEVLQETNLVIWKKWSQFQAGTNFVAWGRAIARLEVFRFRRQRPTKMQFLDSQLLEVIAEEVATRSPELQRKHDALSECLGKLRPQDRQLIRMRYSSNVTGDQVAEELGRPANSVYQSLGRIRRVLMECVRRQLAGSGDPL